MERLVATLREQQAEAAKLDAAIAANLRSSGMASVAVARLAPAAAAQSVSSRATSL